MTKKPDAAEIAAYLDALPKQLGLDGSRRWWPKYAFHSSHIENAASILNDGRLLSRAQAEGTSKLIIDSASPQIISSLSTKERRWVRLYFRPRTPTQFRNQGVRPVHKLYQGAHMPVPVYLLFDSKEVLSQVEVGFTRGRLGQGVPVGYDVSFLETIPFKDVYHDSGVGPLGADRRGEILNARHAEVLAKDALGLDHLRLVICRSAPERDTLLDLLSPTARQAWQDKTIVEEGRRLFFPQFGTYIEKAFLDSSHTRLTFYSSVGPDWRGPFHLEIKWAVPGWNPQPVLYERFQVSPDPLCFKFALPREAYTVTARMDGHLIYCGRWTAPAGAHVLRRR